MRNPVQIAQHAYSAGFRGTDLIRAVAVALAESSGREDVVNSIGATGLWQINQPIHVKRHPEWTKEWLKNPDNNARAAFTLFKESGWRPWNSSRAGQALQTPTANASVQTFLALNPTGIDDQLKGYAGQAASGVTSALPGAEGIAQGVDALAKASAWLGTPANWLRIAYVVGGIALVIVGAAALTAPVVTNAAMQIVPAGKAAKAIKKATT